MTDQTRGPDAQGPEPKVVAVCERAYALATNALTSRGSAMTDDLKQRAEQVIAEARGGGSFCATCGMKWKEHAEHCSILLSSDLLAALAQAEQEKAALEHHEALIEAQTQRGITDCSTPLFIRVQNIVEQLERAEARLSTYEATIRQVEQEIRFVVQHGGVEPGDPYGVDLGLSEAMKERLSKAADTFREGIIYLTPLSIWAHNLLIGG
jgi:hypothetical protein